MRAAQTFRRRSSRRSDEAERDSSYEQNLPELSPETAVSAFQLLSGVGGGLASLIAANRVSGVEGKISAANLAVPIGLSFAGTVAGASLIPGEFDTPDILGSEPRTAVGADRDLLFSGKKGSSMRHAQTFRSRSRTKKALPDGGSEIAVREGNGSEHPGQNQNGTRQAVEAEQINLPIPGVNIQLPKWQLAAAAGVLVLLVVLLAAGSGSGGSRAANIRKRFRPIIVDGDSGGSGGQ